MTSHIRTLTALSCALILAVPASGQKLDRAGAAAGISAADVRARLGIIAHDSMRGRDTPSPGLEMTAAYIASQFKAFGLEPAGDSGSFIQRYPYTVRKLDTKTRMIEMTTGGKIDLKFGSDFFVVPSDADTLTAGVYYAGTVTGPAFAVSGAARGRIVLAAIPDTLDAGWGQRFNTLLISAMTVGAKGIIIALDPRVTTESMSMIAGPISEQAAPLPVFGVRSAALAPLLRAGRIDPARLFRPSLTLDSADLTGVTVRFNTTIAARVARPPNVVGILRGSDPVLKNEYIVFSAHMDHVGVGAADPDGDSIYNGADDDGSGTTAVMEIAQAFSSLATPPKRSVIFLTVSGEEKGLLGSDYFTAHPPVPTASMIADINIDMIGRNNPDSVTAIGLDYTSLGPTAQLVRAAHPELHLVIAPDLQPDEHFFERSDHFNFAKNNVPAIFFTTGTHKDYHRASDEVEVIDAEKLARIAQLAFLLGDHIAADEAKPTWTKAGLAVVKAATGTK